MWCFLYQTHFNIEIKIKENLLLDMPSYIIRIEREKLFMWFIFALLSAVFAALTSILAKIGVEGVNSNLATAIRTVVVVVMAWGMVFLTNTQGVFGRLEEELDFPYFIGACHRCVLAMLLSRAASWGGLQSSSN